MAIRLLTIATWVVFVGACGASRASQSASASTVQASPSPSPSLSPSPSAGPSGSPSPATAIKIEATVGPATASYNVTTTSKACVRDSGNPKSLRVTYDGTNSTGLQHLAIFIPDTSAPTASSAEVSVTLAVTGVAKPITFGSSDVSVLNAQDAGDHATISLTAATAAGNRISATVTCNVIGP